MCDKDNLKRSNVGHCIQLFILLIALLTGCATYTMPMDDPYVVASQTSQIVGGVVGPNTVSGGINNGLTYYQNIDGIIQNPWNGFFILRNLWLP
jgi:hypothetical protein